MLQAPSLPSISHDSEDNGDWNGKHFFVGTERRKCSVLRGKARPAAWRRGIGSALCPVRGRAPISRLITVSWGSGSFPPTCRSGARSASFLARFLPICCRRRLPYYFAWKDSAYMPLHQETRRPSKCKTVGALPFIKISQKSWWRNNRLASLPGE